MKNNDKYRDMLIDIEKTILTEVDRAADVFGYIQNCLLYDMASGAEYYQTTKHSFQKACYQAGKNIIANKKIRC